MPLQQVLSQKKTAIVEKWFDLIINTYPAETAQFLKRQQDPFANPVGAALSEGVGGVVEGLVSGAESAAAAPFLDKIIRVRAIQDFQPAGALAFIFGLKRVIRDQLKGVPGDWSDELLALEARIDELALLAFNVYVQCRERIFEIKINEFRRLNCIPLRRNTFICKLPEDADQGADQNADQDGPAVNATEAR